MGRGGGRRADGERLTDRQRALLDTLPRFAGGDLPALRRLEARGLVAVEARPVRRAPVHLAVGARERAAGADRRPGGRAEEIAAAAPGRGCCCRA